MGIAIPNRWQRGGLILRRDERGGQSSVAGDPCIVWDHELPGWRMVLFYDPPGHAQAICRSAADVGPGQWEFQGPLSFTNPGDLLGGSTHKPVIVMDAHQPNRAARVDGLYWLLTVSHERGHKLIQRAGAEHLAGPWTLDPQALIGLGPTGAFDAKHTDAVTGYYFAERQEFLYFYMGYPDRAQARAVSPCGSAQAVAIQRRGEPTARKLGEVLPPCQEAGHWASGWVGGLQLLPGREHRWIAIVNASPTAPRPEDGTIHREEPPPSLGGFAWCDEEWPVRGWQFCPQPIEWVADIPASALAWGEGTNLWRQHLLVLPGGRLGLFYNSGSYGREQLYLKLAEG